MSRDRRPSPDRRWRIPPLPAHASHSFAGAVVLDELSGPPGFALWQAFRDVQLWSLASPKERSQLFAPGAAAARSVTLSDAELRAHLRVLLGMVERPTVTDVEEVAGACAAIARWAEAHGANATALAFAEAAATTCSEDAALALGAGRLARRRADHGRAETWFLRAAGLGRRSGNWESYAMGWVGMGRIQLQKGNLPRARRHFQRALRTARRYELRDAEGQALHYLCVVDWESGDLEGAEVWAKEVYRVYGPGHVLLPRVAHDLATIWSEQGFCTRAQAVFRALLPHFDQPTDRLYVLSNLVRTAGAVGDRAVFLEVWGAAWELAGHPAAADSSAHSVLDMARGAMLIGERSLAVEAAQRCLATASGREEAKVRLEAEALLRTLHSLQAGEESTEAVETPSRDETGDALAAEIIQGLSVSAAP
jgi:tetratricopeptide (TPR) repeat protein